jgi:phage regulator Rha-like protein
VAEQFGKQRKNVPPNIETLIFESPEARLILSHAFRRKVVASTCYDMTRDGFMVVMNFTGKKARDWKRGS